MITKKEILKRVKEHYNYLISMGYEVLFTALQGSQNYKLDEYSDEYTSDVDTKSIVLPSLDDFIYNKEPVSTVRIMPNSEEHAEVKDIRVMFEMFKKENISYIELLYSDYVIINPKYADAVDKLFKMRDEIALANVPQFLKCLAGMAHEKDKALCHPYPGIIDKINKYGYDGKQLSHCARLLLYITDFSNGKSIAECYKPAEIYKLTLMNYKKQLDENGAELSVEEACSRSRAYLEEIENIKNELIEDNDYEINKCAWYFLDELQARIMKQHILESLTPSFEDFKYFSKEEQEAEARAIKANAVAPKENIYEYYADDGLENLDADKGERSEFAHDNK